jgi:hypothetical protein
MTSRISAEHLPGGVAAVSPGRSGDVPARKRHRVSASAATRLVCCIGGYVLLVVLVRRGGGGAGHLFLVPPVTALLAIPVLGRSGSDRRIRIAWVVLVARSASAQHEVRRCGSG